jgi:hypothetical protein
MLRNRTIEQWVQIFQIAILIIFSVLTINRQLGRWVIFFPIVMFASQFLLWFYEWKKGNRQPLKDAGFRFLVLIGTLLLLLFLFGKGGK